MNFQMTKDVLYHFGFSTDEDDLVALFNNVKFVLCGDSAGRMLKLATYLCKQLKNSNGDEPTNLTRTDRYVLYKVSNCICIRISAGTVNGLLKPVYEFPCLIELYEEIVCKFVHFCISKVQMNTEVSRGLLNALVQIVVQDVAFKHSKPLEPIQHFFPLPHSESRLHKSLLACLVVVSFGCGVVAGNRGVVQTFFSPAKQHLSALAQSLSFLHRLPTALRLRKIRGHSPVKRRDI
ncbi:uridine phosphorylase 1 [Trichinella spiralis]|uniref:uridine phosphorylase 1 n=1 Tax=Trichinella spiralis TaxID=6334 RepID=UPI0001EFCEA9|nr:uridine phosphorylase 1 [Trichinella spiralis]